MSGRRVRTRSLRQIIILMAIPILLSGVGYAIFSQDLSINAKTSNVAYSSSQNLIMTYVDTVTSHGNRWRHNLEITLKNNGSTSTSSWSVTFHVPDDASQLSCQNTVACSKDGDEVTVSSTTDSGVINAGSELVFTLSFRSGLEKYTLQQIHISGVIEVTYETIDGLTVVVTQGNRTKPNRWYEWPVTIRVVNQSGSAVSGWRVSMNWNSGTDQVNSMPSNLTYITNASQLVITGANSIASSSNYEFTTILRSTDANWTANATVQGTQ